MKSKTPDVGSPKRRTSQKIFNRSASSESVLEKKFVPKHLGRDHSLVLEAFSQEVAELPLMRQYAHKILMNPVCDYFLGVIIAVNLVAMIIEVDNGATDDNDSSKDNWTVPFGWVVLLIFIAELILRMFAFRFEFWVDAWNVFDLLVVSVDAVFSVIGLVGGDLFPVSILRVFRLTKLTRVAKILRVFPELRLLIAGLLSSASAILWGTVLLALCLLIWAMAAVLFIHPLNKKIAYEDCARCHRAYSSVMQTMLTLFQQIVAGDAWGETTVPLMETYPITSLFFVPVFLSVGMAVLNLILGVVVSVAEQAKQDIQSEDTKRAVMLKAERHTHLLRLCMSMDQSGEGKISYADMCEAYEHPGEFRDALLSLDISREEIDVVWKVVNSQGNNAIPYEDMISAFYSVKSSEQHFMLAYIKHYITMVKEQLEEKMTEILREEKEIEKEALEVEELKHGIQEEVKEVEALKNGMWQTIDHQNGPRKVNQECEVSHFIESAVLKDDVNEWLAQVCSRIATTHVELEDILSDMKGKFEPMAPPLIAVTDRIVTTQVELQDVVMDMRGKVETNFVSTIKNSPGDLRDAGIPSGIGRCISI